MPKLKLWHEVKRGEVLVGSRLVRLEQELARKAHHVDKLQILLRERLARIDALNDTVAQLRDQNRRLDAENEHLVEMVRLPPP